VHASVRPHRDGVLFVLRDLTRLRRLEAVRRDFVANVSHELKTPLTSIMGFAEAIAESEMPDARRQEFAERILTNSRRMRRLVDDLLELTRIESGRWELAAESVELGAAARAEWAILEPLAKERSVRLAMDAGLPTVTADPGAVRQILRNLFDNALRYAPEGSEVRLSTSTVDGWVRTEISDSGPGIPSAHLARIFERFYRVDPARSREAGGTGLGLAIVKHLVRAHGGEVRAESELGRGTTVWFTLPVASSELIRVTKSLPEAFRLPIDVEKKGEGR
jgi:signal transduction histidine kinase